MRYATPGPWHRGEENEARVDVVADGKVIARVLRGFILSRDEAEANLELILSARDSAAQPIESAPQGRDIFVFNAYYGWYRTCGYNRNGSKVWPLYGLMGAEGGVWYPVPSHWMEAPPTPEGAEGPMTSQLDSAEFHDKRAHPEATCKRLARAKKQD